jgi:hypothetical protein
VPQRNGFGHPLEAITFGKMRTLRQLAALWMREHHVTASIIRLDAIGVVLAAGEPASLVTSSDRQMRTCLEVDRLIGLGGAPDEQRSVGPFWAQTLGVALNSGVVFVGGGAGPLLGPP